MGQADHKPRWNRRTLRALLVIAPAILSGCFWGSPRVYAPQTRVQTPPLTVREADGVVQLTMEAPNPGWRVVYDGERSSREGSRLLFTVRRPDPGMFFTMHVVEKSLRTDHPWTTPSTVWVRVLDHSETTGAYSPTELETDPSAEP